MLGEGGTALSKLKAAVREFQASDEHVDSKELRIVIDSLEGTFCANARRSQLGGEHLVAGNISAASWIARTCGMSVSSAADRVCVGEQLESLPKLAAALDSGQISFQSTSVLCHLREQLGEKSDLFDEEEMLEYAREYSVFQLRKLCNAARHAADPDGFFNDAEESFLRRRLHISQMPEACLPSTALSTRSAGLPSSQGLRSWPSARDQKTSALTPSGWPMRPANWRSMPWSKALCLGATRSSLTST
jgi:hypothetical protein